MDSSIELSLRLMQQQTEKQLPKVYLKVWNPLALKLPTRGLAVGSDIEYADEVTWFAIENRTEL